MLGGTTCERACLVILGSGHIEWTSEVVSDHTSLSDMVGVHMCAYDALYWFVPVHCVEDLKPEVFDFWTG